MYIGKGTGVLVLKIKNKILTKIKQNEKLSRYNIEVEVNEDKVVFLKGEVDSWNQVVEIGHIAGSDVLTTSYTLAQAIKTIAKPDIIFCGKQSTDGDTCQVSPELAEFLGIPHALYVVEINDINDEYIVVTCDMGSYRETVKMNFPCLISVEKDSFIPRFSSLRNKIEAQKKPINTIELKDLEDKDKNNYGYCGSPTKVSKIYVPEIKRETDILDGETDEVMDKLFLKLDEWEVL